MGEVPRSSTGEGDILVHPTCEVILCHLATSLVIGSAVGFDAFQVARDNVLAFSYSSNQISISRVLRLAGFTAREDSPS